MSIIYCFSSATIVARTRLNVTLTSILPVLFIFMLSSQQKSFVVSPDTQTEHKYLKRRQENKREELHKMVQTLETHHYVNIL
jgi:hypothetical protein